MIAPKLLVQDGPLAHRGVGAYYRRQKVVPRLVHKQDSLALLYGPFLSSGQRYSHRALAHAQSAGYVPLLPALLLEFLRT
jgi:hypothetical protein